MWNLKSGRRNTRESKRSSTVRLYLEPLEARDLPSVFTPAQIRHAYGFDQITFNNGHVKADGSGQTIAIVEAFHDPRIASDLHYFDWIFGLPDPPNFMQVNQRGGPTFPAVNPAWALETALDVEWAHAVAPRANILLVEADSATMTDLLAAVNYARYQPGVVVVSMSWGSPEFSHETAYDPYFTTPAGHSGITFVASSGDTGGGTSYPAVSPNVLAVGGTSLSVSPFGNYLSETAWSGSGGGVSLYETKPSFQLGVPAGRRATPDVALNADPYTGNYIYDTVAYAGIAGWFQDAGTSAGAAEWAGLIALADQGRALSGRGSLSNAQALLYYLPASDFHDITTGSNGYAAGPGFDFVTGRGTPIAPLIVQHLLGWGTLTVLPVMAHSVAAGSALPARPFLGGMSFTASLVPWVEEKDSASDVRSLYASQADQEYWQKPALLLLIEQHEDELRTIKDPSTDVICHVCTETSFDETAFNGSFPDLPAEVVPYQTKQ
jgi:subtilase family serine protease